MYSKATLIRKYLGYRLSACNGKGHGVHSPFVFDFITKILNDKTEYPAYQLMEDRRKELLKDKRMIEVSDPGAGSSVIPTARRAVKAIAASSPKNQKYGQLLFRIVNYYQPQTIVELGTSFGITSGYLSLANPNSQVFTIEGSEQIAGIGAETIAKINAKNIQLIRGNFDEILPDLLSRLNTVDFAFVDGNHKKVATLNYFNLLLQRSNAKTILIFDDIHWSYGMEEAWENIKQNPRVTMTMDLFFIGIVFMNSDFIVKQHFTLRF